ncbi:MAG: phospholipase D-like domain-containing protein, partial [Chloroflexota bacterium]
AMYLLSDRDVVDALEASRKRGVVVRVMLEENPFGTGPGNQSVFARLTAAGIAARWGPARFRFNHEKYAVSDGRVALVGTANWTFSAFATNREYLVVDSDPFDVAQLSALFDADWGQQQAAVSAPNLVVSPINSRAGFDALVGAAKQTVDLESEEMEDAGIASVLVAAERRGVRVRAIFPAPTSRADPNAPGERTLVAGEVQVRRLAKPYVHGKELVIDEREAFVGSENFSKASLDENREVGLLLGDPVTIQRIEGTFGRDWQAAKP